MLLEMLCVQNIAILYDSNSMIWRLIFSHFNDKAQNNAEIDRMIYNYLHMRQQIKSRSKYDVT